MAKKKTRSTSAAPRTTASVTASEAVPAKALSTEYHYVIRDLMQIAIIAAVLIAGLVVLSFVI